MECIRRDGEGVLRERRKMDEDRSAHESRRGLDVIATKLCIRVDRVNVSFILDRVGNCVKGMVYEGRSWKRKVPMRDTKQKVEVEWKDMRDCSWVLEWRRGKAA